jgi:hypothetical protein
MPSPNTYKYIRAWGNFLHSYSYYIHDQQQKAAADNAPLNAIYKRGNKWVTVDEIQNKENKRIVESLAR